MKMMKAARGLLDRRSALATAAAFGHVGRFGAGAKVLTMAFDAGAGLNNLDPRTLLTKDHGEVQLAFLDPLVRSYGTDFVPGAAESWEISADGMTYTFHLRDAKWSDGVRVTAGDFVHAFVRMFQSAPASAIYDDILNGAAVRGGTAKPEELGVKAPDREDGRLHASRAGALLPRPPHVPLRRAGSRRHGGEVRRRLRRVGGEPAVQRPVHPHRVGERGQDRPEEEPRLLERRHRESRRGRVLVVPKHRPSGTCSITATSTSTSR